MNEKYLREVQWGVMMIVSMALAGLMYFMVCQLVMVMHCYVR